MTKMRADVVKVINEQILNKITWSLHWDDMYYKPIELHKMIIDFCRQHKVRPNQLKCDVDHYGRLFINDIYIDHIVVMDEEYKKIGYIAEANYWEGRILARQERYYND